MSDCSSRDESSKIVRCFPYFAFFGQSLQFSTELRHLFTKQLGDVSDYYFVRCCVRKQRDYGVAFSSDLQRTTKNSKDVSENINRPNLPGIFGYTRLNFITLLLFFTDLKLPCFYITVSIRTTSVGGRETRSDI